MTREISEAYISVIRAIMTEKGFSQQKFAAAIGVNQTTVSQWLRGKKKPTYDNIYLICVEFNIMPNEFFGM